MDGIPPLPAGYQMEQGGGAATEPTRPGVLKRLGQSLGMPTSRAEVEQMQAREEALPWYKRLFPHMPGQNFSGASMLAGPAGPMAEGMIKGYGQTAAKGFQEGKAEQEETQRQFSRGEISPSQARGKSAAAAMHTVLQAVPFIGPTVETMGEDALHNNWRGYAGGGLGVAAQILGPKLIESAPGVMVSAGEALGKARQSAAEGLVKPLVKSTPANRMADAKYGRNPASAIVDEGIVGKNKQSVLNQVQSKATEISKAVDQQLQNHPNAGVQIDAEPIIDKAINDAVVSARKVGNKGAVNRLEDLREALKKEYGPLQGTPFEINNLKRAIGDAGSDLGAFKHTDPAEASAAAAMGDVYTGLNKAIKTNVPEIGPLNERISNLLSAKTALTRNIIMEQPKGVLDAIKNVDIAKPIKSAADIAGSVVATTPVRTGVARAIAGVPKKIPRFLPQPAPPPTPIKGLLPAAPIELPSRINPIEPYSSAPGFEPTSRASRKGLLLPENASMERPIKMGSNMEPIEDVGPISQPAAKGLPARTPKGQPGAGQMRRTYLNMSTVKRPPVMTWDSSLGQMVETPQYRAASSRSLPSDFTIHPEESVNGSNLVMKDSSGKSIGSVGIRDAGEIGPKSASEIGDIQVASKGKGYGQALYQKAAEHAAAKGDGFLVSSAKPTAEAAAAWERLAKSKPDQIRFINGRWMWNLDRMKQAQAGTIPNLLTRSLKRK